jgi:hypothetical protein
VRNVQERLQFKYLWQYNADNDKEMEVRVRHQIRVIHIRSNMDRQYS